MVFEALPRRAGVAPYFLTGHIPHIAARGFCCFLAVVDWHWGFDAERSGRGYWRAFFVMSTDSVSVSTFFDVYVC